MPAGGGNMADLYVETHPQVWLLLTLLPYFAITASGLCLLI